VLGDTIGFDLEVEAQEKQVGPFRADILCKDLRTGNWVLIENQLERTDHIHLGQLLVYASGLKAVTIVWIARQFTDEHRATLDWLNSITDEEFQFFGLEIELWCIGSSPPAPNLISCQNLTTGADKLPKQPSGSKPRTSVTRKRRSSSSGLALWTFLQPEKARFGQPSLNRSIGPLSALGVRDFASTPTPLSATGGLE
jgi:hypothetical protein